MGAVVKGMTLRELVEEERRVPNDDGHNWDAGT
jgi:hypothetical protein